MEINQNTTTGTTLGNDPLGLDTTAAAQRLLPSMANSSGN